jgi:hypothetical protein
MPKSAYADVMQEWEALLAAAQHHGAGSSDFQPYLEAFRQHVEKVKNLKAEQVSANAIRQQRTQQITAEIGEGYALAMRLRGVVRARIGPYSELLVNFGMKPIRPRSRRASADAGEPPAGLTAPAPPEAGELS